MRRATHHFTKDQPVRIKRGVPFQWATRLVPKLHPLEKFSESTYEDVEKIRVLFRIARRRAFTWSNTKTRRRVMKTGKHIELACKTRQ